MRTPEAQNVDVRPAIALDFPCPTFAVSGTQPLTLQADILGTEDSEVIKPLIFRWSSSKGRIANGQGTPKVTISDLENVDNSVNSVQVHLVVNGGPPELSNEKSCVIRVNPACSLTPPIDQFQGISIDEETQHLARFAEALKSAAPESIGYIVSYAGRTACINEAKWRANRALQYLVKSHNIPAKRIVTVEGGFRENSSVELFIQPNSDCGPLPAPTLRRVQAHVEGKCN